MSFTLSTFFCLNQQGPALPRRLADTWKNSVIRHTTETDPADTELAVNSLRAPTARAARVFPGGKFGLTQTLHDHRFLSHYSVPLLSVLAERKIKLVQQCLCLRVILSVGHKRDAKAANPVDLFIVDLWKNDLFFKAE